MKKQLVRAVLSVVAMVMSAASIAQALGGKLQGVWKVVEVTSTGPNAATNTRPQPGLYIFTAKHYSIQRVLSDELPPDLPADVNKATAAELLASWGPIVALSGTYELAGTKLTMRPTVAKNPAFMKGNPMSVASIKLEGNTLWLTLERNPAGPVANPATVKLTRAE
jgi:hypothetical protein